MQVGLRGIGSARKEEVAAARDWGSHLVTAAQIHEHGIEAAIALVPEGAQIPDGSLALGIPARVVRPVSEEETQRILRTAEHYINLKNMYLKRIV